MLSIFACLLLFSCSVVSNSLWPHGLQHPRLPCPSSSPRACSNSCPLSHWCHPTILPPLCHLTSVFPSIRVFSNESALRIRWPKSWRFSFSISPSNKYSGFISFRIDWFDLLAVQGTPKSLLLLKSSQELFSRVQKHQFFGVQPSLWSSSHIHTWLLEKPNIALTIWTFVRKVMSLFFNKLSRLVIAFLSRSKHLSISWL